MNSLSRISIGTMIALSLIIFTDYAVGLEKTDCNRSIHKIYRSCSGVQGANSSKCKTSLRKFRECKAGRQEKIDRNASKGIFDHIGDAIKGIFSEL